MYPVQEDVGGPDDGWWIYNGEVGMKQYAVAVAIPYNPNAEADANRIVACVNACAAWTSAELEDGMPLKQIESAMTAIANKDQRIAALEASERRLRAVLEQIATDIAIGATTMRYLAQCAITAGIEVK